MPGYQVKVVVASAGTAVALASSANPVTFIAKGGTIQASPNNIGNITIGTSAVTKSTAASPVYMFLLLPGDSVPLPGYQAVDMSAMFVNGDSANDYVTVGYWQ